MPLMAHQEYLGEVKHGEPDYITHNFAEFRSAGLRYGKNLSRLHSEYVGIELPAYRPWLRAPADPRGKGRVIIHRSPRYHNPNFPWGQIVSRYGERILAIGLEEEVRSFEENWGVKVEWQPTKGYLDLAGLLAGCDLFIGNQSSPMAIAIGLGVPSVQETCLWQPDCLYEGANVYYGTGYSITVDGEEIGDTSHGVLSEYRLPPRGWIVEKDGRIFRGDSIGNMLPMIRKFGVTKEMILEQNTRRVKREHPSFLRHTGSEVDKILMRGDYCVDVKTRLTKNVVGEILVRDEEVYTEGNTREVEGTRTVLSTEGIDNATPTNGFHNNTVGEDT
jgi:hypothetical protein